MRFEDAAREIDYLMDEHRRLWALGREDGDIKARILVLASNLQLRLECLPDHFALMGLPKVEESTPLP